MKITIPYDNTVFQSGLKPDWGFSCLVETHNRNILFDTGSNGSILLENIFSTGELDHIEQSMGVKTDTGKIYRRGSRKNHRNIKISTF
jgi:hypothetical protein